MSCTFLNETELYKCALILTNENIKTIKQFKNLKNAFLVIVNSKKAHLLHKIKICIVITCTKIALLIISTERLKRKWVENRLFHKKRNETPIIGAMFLSTFLLQFSKNLN